MFNAKRLFNFLATGNRPVGSAPSAQADGLALDSAVLPLDQHDIRFHHGHYDPSQSCSLRTRWHHRDQTDSLLPSSATGGASASSQMTTPQDEYDAVVAKFRNTPLWMKAPNGNPTNLTKRQWIQVRTPSFKKWFGDWERFYYTKGWFDIVPAGEVLKMKPIDVSNFGMAENKDQIKRHFEIFGTVRNQNDGREVRFPAKSAGRFVFVKNYVPAFRKLFETSIRAWSENETKFEGHKEHSNILRYHHYLNKFETTDGEYFVRFTVREGSSDAAEGSNLVHAANVSEVEVYKKKVARTDTLDRSATSSAGQRPHVDYKIANYLEGVNRESVSKVIDENGEPMVVWHETDWNITSHDNAFRIDESTDGVAWFSNTKSRKGYEHGANAYRFFLKLNNPKVIEAEAYLACEMNGEGLETSNDGAIFRNTANGRMVFTVTNPNQVKSAIDNSGAFSTTSDNTFDESPVSPAAKYLAYVNRPVADESLQDHDRRFHPDGFDPETDTCGIREDLASNDAPDAALSRASAAKPKDNDAAYLDAVKRGDMETAQRMVREAAAKAMPDTKVVGEDGLPLVVYHGTDKDITSFNISGLAERIGWSNFSASIPFFTPSVNVAKTYGDIVRAYFINIRNPVVFDENDRRNYQKYRLDWRHKEIYNPEYGRPEEFNTTEVALIVKDKSAKDGVIFKNALDFGFNRIAETRDNAEADGEVDSFAVMSQSQIKSADPVTYDDDGNPIPLSKRFDFTNPDIRY